MYVCDIHDIYGMYRCACALGVSQVQHLRQAHLTETRTNCDEKPRKIEKWRHSVDD